MALTAQQIAALIAAQGRSGQDAYYDPNTNYQMLAQRGATQSGGHIENGEWLADPITGYRATEGAIPNGQDRTWLNGHGYQNFDPTGQQTGTGTWQGLTPDGWKDDLTQIAKGAAVMGLTAFGGGLLQGAGGAGTAGGSGAFLGEGAASGVPAWDGAMGASQMGGVGGAGGSGAFLGEGVQSGIPAWDGTAGVGGAAPAGGSGWSPMTGSAGGGSGGGSGAFLGENVASGVPAWDTAAKTAGLTLTGAAGSAPSWLGPAATLAGAVLGSKPNTQSQTSQHTMDPRLDGPVFGPGGIVQRSQGLLDQQMSPDAQQGFLDMQRVGRGLTSQPIAGNGYGLFAGRKLY